MNERCPVCGLRYEREQGYFLGAMIVSYILSIPIILLLVMTAWWLTDWSLQRLLLVSWLVFLPFVPGIVRLARSLWIHFDRWVDPD